MDLVKQYTSTLYPLFKIHTDSLLLQKFKTYLKKAFSILMLIAILLPSLTKIGILIDFKINQDFIAAIFCINKEEPIVMCNGKCYLVEQLNKAEEQEEKQIPIHQEEQAEIIYYYSNVSLERSDHTSTYLYKLNPAYENDFYPNAFVASIFRPPKLILS